VAAGLDDLVHRADLDGLVRLIDSLTTARDWPQLLLLRDRCRAAVSTGRQLWPAATLAEYRLALWGDAHHCATVLDDDASGRFSIGPLTEVAAQHHTAAELAAAGLTGPRLGLVAHERALRGESIDPDTFDPLEMPFALQPWEPAYPLATYGDDGIDAPSPPIPPLIDAHLAAASLGLPTRVDEPEVERAARELLVPWTEGSNGRAEVVCVAGEPLDALGALGVHRPRLGELSAPQALAWLAWAGASGGAHGRRRGGAAGRFATWWLLAAIGGLTDDWPCDPDELGALADELRWWWWDAHEPQLGWELRLVIDDPEERVCWAISAQDAS
jgi:hypothetical protein